jgi:hypothetical protein
MSEQASRMIKASDPQPFIPFIQLAKQKREKEREREEKSNHSNNNVYIFLTGKFLKLRAF